jgi:hypothetical protein
MLGAVMLTSCYKQDYYYEDDRSITGSWILTDAAAKDAYGWYPVITGVENGIFDFYNSGGARYTERSDVFTGSWQIYYSNDGYYDEYGNYYSDRHQSMQVNLTNRYGESIDMYFDDVRISGNSITATNYSNHNIERYRFSRY